MRTGRRRVGFEPLNDDRESVQLEKNDDDDDDEESSPREYRPFGNRDEESVGSSLASFPDYPLSHSSKGDNASTFRDERMKRRSTILSKPAPHKSKEVVKAGYMLKEGKVFKTWKNRYFVLRNNHLYYLEKQGGKVKGKFRTEQSTVTEAVERKIPHCFKISTQERIWYLQAKSDEDMFAWIDAIIDYGGATEILPDLDPKMKLDLGNFSDSDNEEESKTKPTTENELSSTLLPASSSSFEDKPKEEPLISPRKVEPKKKQILPSADVESEEEEDKDVDQDDTTQQKEEEEDEEEEEETTPTAIPKPKLTQDSATLNFIKKLAKDKEQLLEEEDEPDEISETETDEMYDSDHEMYELLQNSKIPQPKKPSMFEEPTAPKQKQTKPTTEVADYKNLFTFFDEKSAKQNGKIGKTDNRRRKKAILQTVPSNEQANVNYLEKVLEDISIVDKQGNLKQNLNLEDLKASLREGTHQYMSDDDEDAIREEDGYKIMADEFKDLVILKSRPTSSLETVTHGELAEETSHYLWDDFLSVFKSKQDHFCLSILVTVLVLITCVILLTQFFASLHQVKLLIMDTRETRTTWLVFLLSERLINLMQELFINSNYGIFSIIALTETSLSAAGAFFIAFYSKNKMVGSKNSGETSPLFLDGYVGRVLQLGMTSLMIVGLFSSFVILGLTCLFFYILNDTMGLNLSLNYILMRVPSIFLYLFSGLLHAFLFASLKIWQWLIVTLVSSSSFFILLYTVVIAKSDPLFTMAVIFDAYLLIHFLVSGTFLFFSDFRTKQKVCNFAQDIYTVARNFRFQFILFAVNIIPFGAELYNLLYFSFSFADASEIYTVLLIGFVMYLIQQVSSFVNSVSTIYGIRLVKRKQHNRLYLLFLKSLVTNIIIAIVMIILIELPPIQDALTTLIIGQGIVASPGEESKLIQTISGHMSPVYICLGFCIPIAVMHSMYQSFMISFENFNTILFTTLAAQFIIRIPCSLISSLAFQSHVGIPVGWAASQLMALFVYVLVVHVVRLPELKKQRRDVEKQMHLENEFGSANYSVANKLLLPNQ